MSSALREPMFWKRSMAKNKNNSIKLYAQLNVAYSPWGEFELNK